MGIFLFRWFGIGCAAGCVLVNLLLDRGYPDVACAVRFLMGAAYFGAAAFRRFPAAAVGSTFIVMVFLLALRRTHRVYRWMVVIVLATGGIYAGVSAVFVRGMMAGYLMVG
ncbi:MAG: hypothetical protein LUD07_05965 [Clostridiales bacterium]|nr:hypothetical protein [Clostridiales bacterium]